MYKHSGKTIKRNAKIVTIILSVYIFLVAIVAAASLIIPAIEYEQYAYIFLGLVIGGGIVAVGQWLIGMAYSMMYGFGVIVDKMEQWDPTGGAQPQVPAPKAAPVIRPVAPVPEPAPIPAPAPIPEPVPAPAPVEPPVAPAEDGAWECTCGFTNTNGGNFCENCGKHK